MEAKEILTKIKQLFADLTAPVAAAAPEAVLPTEYELKDGGKVMIDKLEVGGIVMVDGAAALPGDIELADGTKLTVADNGVISDLTMGTGVEPVEPIAEPAMEDMGAKFTAFEIATNEKFANYSSKFEAQEIQLGKMTTQLNKANKVIEQLLTLSQLIVDAPAAAPDAAAKTSNNFKEEKQQYSSILFN
jgi:hypothetical protein